VRWCGVAVGGAGKWLSDEGRVVVEQWSGGGNMGSAMGVEQ